MANDHSEKRRKGKFVSNKLKEKLKAQEASKNTPRVYTAKEIAELKDVPEFELGAGNASFSHVYRGHRGEEIVAIKEYKKKGDYPIYMAEKDFLLSARNDGIVKLYGYCDEESFALVLEYAPKELSKSIKDLDWGTTLKILHQAAEALNFIHEQGKVYCDFKPDNMLLTDGNDIRLIDFNAIRGVNKYWDIYTDGYDAPERSKNACASTKADVYSFGVVMLQMLTKSKTVGQRETGRSTTAAKEPHIVTWAKQLETGKYGVVHEELVLDDVRFEHDAKTITALAMECVLGTPPKRPTMKKVAESLRSLL